MKSLYTVVERGSQVFLSPPTFDREVARSTKQSLKQLGLDPIILASKLDREASRTIR